jgi:hypothetical protein
VLVVRRPDHGLRQLVEREQQRERGERQLAGMTYLAQRHDSHREKDCAGRDIGLDREAHDGPSQPGSSGHEWTER